ncbi:MAG TPA: ribosome maturation factor RimM [Methylococcaceae bacterium]|nr:ribosome maturation factor RimM [Methylococcaceae bacterium]
MTDRQYILVGEISGVFGLKGWVKIFSYTEPRENILSYSAWQLRKNGEIKSLKVKEGQRQGKNVVAHLDAVDDRDVAESLIGWEIYIERDQLPTLTKDEYYWADLIGLNVITKSGVELGVIDHLFETGANDVLVVSGDRERLIPFLMGQTVLEVDLDGKCLTVDWDPDF